MESHPRVSLNGLGLSCTLDEALTYCRWKMLGQPPWSRLDYLSIGVDSRSLIPEQLPELLRESGTKCTAHLLEVNLVKPLSEQRSVVEALLPRIQRLAPICVEEDIGVWRWGGMDLMEHMVQPVLDHDAVEIAAENIRALVKHTGVPFLAENPPFYFLAGDLGLLEFMNAISDRGNAGLVLDIGHFIGYCALADLEPADYLASWRGIDALCELHVAGYQLRPDAQVPMWYDDHAQPISEYALDLAGFAIESADRPLPITLEQEGASHRLISEHIDRVSGRFFDARSA